MKTMKLKAILLLAVVAAPSHAQTLSKEITLDKEIVPEQQEARRLTMVPATVQPTFAPTTLKLSERSTASAITPMIATLEPAITAMDDSLDVTQRGYAAIGYFPTYNLAASAGYRFIDTKTTRANAWLQFDGASYDRDGLTWDHNTLTLNGSLSHQWSTRSALDATANYTFYQLSRPWVEDSKAQMIHRGNIAALYHGSFATWLYSVGANIGVVAFGRDDLKLADTFDRFGHTNETTIGLNGTFSIGLNATSRAGVRASADFNSYNHFNNANFLSTRPLPTDYPDTREGQAQYAGAYDEWFDSYPQGGETLGLVKLNPYWSANLGNGFAAELGANIDLSINSGRSIGIAPNCALSWSPTAPYNLFAASLRATGGTVANTLGSLIDQSVYTSPSFAYDHSHVPYEIEASVTVGPWRGAYIELSATYAKAENWLVAVNSYYIPTYLPEGSPTMSLDYIAADFKGWKYGVRAGYAFGRLAEVSASLECSSNKPGKGYYRWTDFAAQSVSTQLLVRPIDRLDVTLGFDGRFGGKGINNFVYGQGPIYYHLTPTRSVNLGASYRVNNRLTLFARGENLTNNKNYGVFSIPTQGARGLVGAQYRF